MSFGSTNLQRAFDQSLPTVDALFKNDYLSYYENTYNNNTVLLSMVKKTKDFVGKRKEFPAPLSFGGGVGSGRLPEANTANYGDVYFTAKKMYSVARVERESLGASANSKGAFVEAITELVKKVSEADSFNQERAAMGDGTGALGVINTGGVTDNGSGNYTLIVSATGGTSTTWKEANFEERMFVNIGTGNTDLFEITAVVSSTRAITVQRQAGGSKVPTAADSMYMQGSQNNDIQGLEGVCLATSGSLYGVTVGRRWQSQQILNYGSTISMAVINRLCLQQEKATGKPPKYGLTSYKQFEKLINQTEDLKRYPMPSNEKVKGGFKGIDVLTTSGIMTVMPSRFCRDDIFFALNPDYITYYQRPNSGFVKEDISANPYGYLRVVDEDQFELRHATYGELFIAPPFQSVITGLTTA